MSGVGPICTICGVEGEQHEEGRECIALIVGEIAKISSTLQVKLTYFAPELWPMKIEQYLKELDTAKRMLFRVAWRRR
jgi:hypothetical protein